MGIFHYRTVECSSYYNCIPVVHPVILPWVNVQLEIAKFYHFLDGPYAQYGHFICFASFNVIGRVQCLTLIIRIFTYFIAQ